MNPRMMWCYSGETFMGVIRPLCLSSSNANALWQVPGKACEKYRRAMDMLLRDPESWVKTLKV